MSISKKYIIAFTMLVMSIVVVFLAARNTYAADSDFTIEKGVLKKYNGEGGDVVIPDTVTKIGDSAFYYCTSLKSVVIPDTVTSIGEHVFEGCSSLTEVVVPDSVTTVGFFTFSYCTKLKSVKLSSQLTSLPEGLFNNCTSLKRVEIPDGVTEIFYTCFYNCTSLVYVNMPSSLRVIYPWAFNNCTKLTAISFPKTLEIIGGSAFIGCDSLTTVYYASGSKHWKNVAIRNEWNGQKGGNSCIKKATKVYNKATVYFNDIISGTYYAEHVKKLYLMDAIDGDSASTFGVNTLVDRATLVSILYRIEGRPYITVKKAPFPDVKLNKWYTSAIAWAKKTKISTGYSNTGLFGVNDNLTREDFMVFLYRYANYKKYDVTVESADAYLEKEDAGKVSPYAAEAVNWGYSNKLIGNGSPLNPKGKITKVEAATIVSRFIEKYTTVQE